MTDQFRGILYPARLPEFSRLPASAEIKDLVRWFWIPQWNLEPGRSSRQQLIAFPASNLVVESLAVENLAVESTLVEGSCVEAIASGSGSQNSIQLELSGPTTKVSHRDLSGKGWAVGALLKPAAAVFWAEQAADSSLSELQDSSRLLFPKREKTTAHDLSNPDPRNPDAKGLLTAVTQAMDKVVQGEAMATQYKEIAVAAFQEFLLKATPKPGEEALLANQLADLIETDKEVTNVEQVALKLNVSTRTVQRLAKRYVGLSASAMIRRRRLQEAAETIRNAPETDLATLATNLGYSDHAHLSNEFQKVLGLQPSGYRRAV